MNEIELEIIYDLNNITVVSQNALTFEKTFPGVGLCYPHGLNDPQTANRVKLFFYLSPPDRAGHFHSFPTLF